MQGCSWIHTTAWPNKSTTTVCSKIYSLSRSDNRSILEWWAKWLQSWWECLHCRGEMGVRKEWKCSVQIWMQHNTKPRSDKTELWSESTWKRGKHRIQMSKGVGKSIRESGGWEWWSISGVVAPLYMCREYEYWIWQYVSKISEKNLMIIIPYNHHKGHK